MTERYDNVVKPEDRLFCLLLALLTTYRGMSKHDIFSTVRGYRDEFLSTGATDALNRKFDRDKEDLKSLGVPLRTTETENPADSTYLIPQEDYTFQFTDAELSLLTAASAVWTESAHSAEAREARVRLSAAEADGAILESFAPRIGTLDNAYGPVAAAISERQVITFPYLKPGESKYETREVTPLSLLEYDGRWHLLAYDHFREAERTFLLRRIVGKVVTTRAEPRGEYSADTTREFKEHLDDLWERLTASVRVVPKTKAAGVLANRRGTTVSGDVYTIHYLDEAVLADELCEYGPEALVLEPATLRNAVIARLERLVRDHA